MNDQGWIGVDLDGVLAVWDEAMTFPDIGPPIPRVVEQVRRLLAQGSDVRIFTARVAIVDGLRSAYGISDATFVADQRIRIERWCREHLGQVLPITAQKDFQMIALFDDHCVQMVPNTGESLAEQVAAIVAGLRDVLEAR